MRRSVVAVALVVVAACASAQNRAVSFSGLSHYLTVADSPAHGFTTACTVECWFRPSGGPQGAPSGVLVAKGGGPAGYALGLDDGVGSTAYFGVLVAGSFVKAEAQLPPLSSGWHHLSGVFDGAAIRLHLDGAEIAVAPTTGPMQTVSGPLGIGSYPNSAEEKWFGEIDEVRLWNVARTATEVAADRFNSLQFAPGLVGVYRLDGNLADAASNLGATAGLFPPVFVTNVPPVAGTYLTSPSATPQGTWCVFQLESFDVGALYYFDVSLTGTVPGTAISSNPLRVAPLNRPLLLLDYGPFLPGGTFLDFVGVVPPSHAAFPRFALPAAPWMTGLLLRSSFAVIDPATFYVRQIHPVRTTIVQATVAAPLVLTPAFGPDTGGTAVTITGAGFLPSSTVRFDGVAASTVYVGPTQLVATTPPGAPGFAHVAVYAGGAALAAAVADGFLYVPTPAVASVVPAVPTPGATVTVYGVNFDPACVVEVGGVSVPATFVSSSELSFVAGVATPCDAALVVTNPDGQTASAVWNASPSVSFAYAAAGPAAGGGAFVLLGSFPAGVAVTVGGAPATVLSAEADFLLVAAPPGAVGPTTGAVTSLAGCAASFAYLYL